MTVQLPSPCQVDHWRFAADGHAAAAFREWQHVVVITREVDLLINFSLTADAAQGQMEPCLTPRVIVIARAQEWTSLIQSAPFAWGDASRDGDRLVIRDHVFTITESGYAITIDEPARDTLIRLELTQRMIPVIARNQSLGSASRLNWAIYPRLAVRGRGRIEGRELGFTDAVAYHDHNWGRFNWGDDFSWDWGIVLPSNVPEAFVHSSLSNGSRSLRSLTQAFYWRGPYNELAASGADVALDARGRFRSPPALRTPGVLALAEPRLDADIPAVLETVVRNGRDWLELETATEAYAQLMLPSDTDALAAVTINECVGRTRARGVVGGKRVRWTGRAVFESVTVGRGAAVGVAPRHTTGEGRVVARTTVAGRLLDRSFLVLRREAPRHYSAAVERLGTLRLALTVAGETALVGAVDGELTVEELDHGGSDAEIVVTADDLDVITVLLDGESTFLEAVMTNRLDVTGDAGALARAADCMNAYLHGLARCPSAPALLEELRAAANRRGHGRRE